jgi:excinuclease ABC subunit C
VRRLVDAGFGTVEVLAAATVEQLSEVPGVGEKTAEKILASARGENAPEDTVGDAASGESGSDERSE